MPLSKAKNRARMKKVRATYVQPNQEEAVQPRRDERLSKLETQGLTVDGSRISPAPQSKSSPLKEDGNSRLPLYNPRVHKQGARVLMRGATGKLIEIVVPELDGEGNPIPGY